MQQTSSGPQTASTTREALDEELEHLRKRLDGFAQEERRLVEGYRKGLYPDFMMREEMEWLHADQAAAEERRRELERQLAHLDRALSYQGQVEELAQRLSQGLAAMDFQQRRELLRLLVDEVIYDNGKVTIKVIIPLNERRLHPVPQ